MAEQDEKEQGTYKGRDSLPSVDERLLPLLDEILEHMTEQNCYAKKSTRSLMGNNRRLVALLVTVCLLTAVTAWQSVRMERLVAQFEAARQQLVEMQTDISSTRTAVDDAAKKVDERTSVDVVQDEEDPDNLKIVVKTAPNGEKHGTRKPPKSIEIPVTPKTAKVVDDSKYEASEPKEKEALEEKK